MKVFAQSGRRESKGADGRSSSTRSFEALLESFVRLELPSLLSLSLFATGCLCSDNVSGVHDGDRIQTTIIARETDPQGHRAVEENLPSCGDLGDLAPGAVLVARASLSGASDSCFLEVDISGLSLSTGTLDGRVLTLPNGCSGSFGVSFQPRLVSPPVLDNGLDDAGEPQWWLARGFTPIGDAAACPDAAHAACIDAFIARNVRLGR